MIKNVLLDVDGVLWQHGKVIFGTKKTIDFLEKNGFNYLFVTNITRTTKTQLAKNFANEGLTAFRLLLGGAELLTNTRIKHAPLGNDGKPALATGPFVKALEYASGKNAVVIGKPSKEFFEQALAKINADPKETIMVGDNLETDILGAKNIGIMTVLVKTGSFRQKELEKSVIKPDYVIESIVGLPQLLEKKNELRKKHDYTPRPAL